MRLYYMTSLETLEQHILPELRIRLSTFDTVNDPFELLKEPRNRRLGMYSLGTMVDNFVPLGAKN